MIKLSEKNKLCINVLNILCFLFSFFLIYYLLIPVFIASPPIHESLFEPFRSEFPWLKSDSPLILLFSNPHPYCILSFFHTLTNRFIPEFLHTHPMNYILNYNYNILILCFLFQLYVIKENFIKYFQNKKFSDILLTIIFPIFFCILVKNLDLAINDDCWGYAYLLLPAFAYALFSKIEYLYVCNEKITTKDIFILVVLFISVAVSNEIFKLMLCSGAFILYILHIIFINKRINHKKYWVLYVIGVVILLQNLLNPVFASWVSTRINHYSVMQIINMLPDYFAKMYNVYFTNNLLLALVLILLCFLFLLSPKSVQRKRLLLFLISFVLSLFITLSSFILGYDKDYSGVTYMFEHLGIVFITKIVFLNLIFSILGYLICIQNNIYKKIIIPIIIFLILLVPTVKSVKYNYHKVISYYGYEKYMLTRRFYILERLFVDYGVKNRIYYRDYKRGSINFAGIYYFKNLYDRKTSPDYYRAGYICRDTDTFPACQHKLIAFTEEKTGYTFTEEELRRADFSVYQKYIVWF